MQPLIHRSLISLPKLLLVWSCSSVALLAQTNQTITGNLSVVGLSDFGGNPDFNGNSLSFGSRNSPLSTTPGAIWTYADGTTPQITWSANQTGLTWLWHSGTSPQFRVDGTNTLGLFVPGATTPAITLNPAGPSTFAQGLTVTGALTASGGLSSSGGTVNGGATGLTLNSGGTNQNITLAPNGTGWTTTARPLRVTNNTASTSSGTGALTVAGGVGVAGELTVGGATSSTARLTVAGTSNTNTASAANFTDSTGKSLLLVRNDGNVGIGTATPSTKLQVKGGAIQQITAFDNWSGIYLDAVSNQPKVGFRVSDNSERFRVAFQGVNTTSERLAFVKTLAGENEVLSVLATGNIGIGTTAPVSRLTLAGGGNPNPNTGAQMDYVGQNLTFRGINAGGTFTLGGVKMVQPNGYFVDAADMVFSTASGGGVLNEVLRINRGGNVGIGTTAPTSKLDVAGDAKISGALSVNGQPVLTANSNASFSQLSSSGTIDAGGKIQSPKGFVFSGAYPALSDSTPLAFKTWYGGAGLAVEYENPSFPADFVLRYRDSNSESNNWSLSRLGVHLERPTSSFNIKPHPDATSPVLVVYDKNQTSSLKITPEGNIGIGLGTNAPEGNVQIAGKPSFDSSTILNLTNGATDFGRTTLRLTGRMQDGNEAWSSPGGARNSVVFARNLTSGSNTGVGALGVDQFSLQYNMLEDKLGVVANDGAAKLVVQQNGNVGIGTTTPTAKLEVTGDTKVTNLAVSGTLAVTKRVAKLRVDRQGDIGMGSFTATPAVE